MESYNWMQMFEAQSDSYYHGYHYGLKDGFHKGLTWAILAMFGCVVVGIVALWLVGPLWLTTN